MGRMTKTKRPMTVFPSVTGRNQIRGATEMFYGNVYWVRALIA